MKIFNQILFGNLMPWVFDPNEIELITENIKQVANKKPATEAALLAQLKTLLSHTTDLVKWLKKQQANDSKPLTKLYFSTTFPAITTIPAKFYSTIIDKETHRIFNAYLNWMGDNEDPITFNFHTTLTLRTIKRYIIAASKDIRKREFKDMNNQEMPLIPFVLYYLKYALITLYFSIQEVKKEMLENVIDIKDFYLMELNEKITDIHPINFEGPEGKSIVKNDSAKTKRLTFGYHGNKENLKSIIDQLCFKVELLNEEKSPADMLFSLLTSKDIKPGEVQIYLDCDNKNFRYIIESLSSYFTSLSFINIEHSKSFYSKKGTLLKANNFSKAKSFDPKLKATIDRIFKQMQ